MSVPRRLGDAERLQPQRAVGDRRQIARLLRGAAVTQSSVPIVYICAWQAAPLPPGAWISSMIAAAADMVSPLPPYSSGMSAARKPASVSAATKASG